MSDILIAYSTIDGHTLKICARLQQLLEQNGRATTLVEIREGLSLDSLDFEHIVIGASIRYGKHRPAVYRLIEENRRILEQKRGAFFSVNVVARKRGKDTVDTNPYIKKFRRETTWVPAEVAVFAGRIDYPSYGFFDRHIIRFIMWLTNGPTDPRGCHEFTDWQAVDAFADKILAMGA